MKSINENYLDPPAEVVREISGKEVSPNTLTSSLSDKSLVRSMRSMYELKTYSCRVYGNQSHYTQYYVH